jgi:hypothetical protein
MPPLIIWYKVPTRRSHRGGPINLYNFAKIKWRLTRSGWRQVALFGDIVHFLQVFIWCPCRGNNWFPLSSIHLLFFIGGKTKTVYVMNPTQNTDRYSSQVCDLKKDAPNSGNLGVFIYNTSASSWARRLSYQCECLYRSVEQIQQGFELHSSPF